MVLPLQIGLGLNRKIAVAGGYTFANAEAEAYDAYLLTQGVVTTDAQKAGIDQFITDISSFKSKVKHAYLPIWGAAAPNARNIMGTQTGLFLGNYRLENGFFHGGFSRSLFGALRIANHTTWGEFDSHHMAALVPFDPRGYATRIFNANYFFGPTTYLDTTSHGTDARANSIAISNATGTEQRAYLISRESSTAARYHRRGASSEVVAPFPTTSVASWDTTGNSSSFGGRVIGTSLNQYGSAPTGMGTAGLGLTQAEGSILTQAMIDCWEACTGRSLATACAIMGRSTGSRTVVVNGVIVPSNDGQWALIGWRDNTDPFDYAFDATGANNSSVVAVGGTVSGDTSLENATGTLTIDPDPSSSSVYLTFDADAL